ncbi:DUF5412 domain-containing protein [Lederbergia sp. NSJ-179]|uniref:DUF5412 family protein n=1 Tax=Lederbergia sp. NSJ-179 TaxID=2931402 RepID=UPI001FD3804E|nr:DUF5412 family protein [Lederbergia sp. NSJ-179]MCJ7842208.1 DUF5412 domain-containing protein [Lederbergia sp. NSJ-179]
MNTIKKISLFVILPIFIVIIFLFFILDSLFFNISLDRLNGTGEKQEEYTSPNGKYKAEFFIINKGGATADFQERVSITSLKDNKKEFKDKTIYWLYPSKENTTIQWKDDNTIIINDKIINIHNKKSYYNWKKDNDLS